MKSVMKFFITMLQAMGISIFTGGVILLYQSDWKDWEVTFAGFILLAIYSALEGYDSKPRKLIKRK